MCTDKILRSLFHCFKIQLDRTLVFIVFGKHIIRADIDTVGILLPSHIVAGMKAERHKLHIQNMNIIRQKGIDGTHPLALLHLTFRIKHEHLHAGIDTRIRPA